MVKFTIAQRNRAVGMLQTGMSSRAVASAFNSCHSTILRLLTLFQKTGRCFTEHPFGRSSSFGENTHNS